MTLSPKELLLFTCGNRTYNVWLFQYLSEEQGCNSTCREAFLSLAIPTVTKSLQLCLMGNVLFLCGVDTFLLYPFVALKITTHSKIIGAPLSSMNLPWWEKLYLLPCLSFSMDLETLLEQKLSNPVSLFCSTIQFWRVFWGVLASLVFWDVWCVAAYLCYWNSPVFMDTFHNCIAPELNHEPNQVNGSGSQQFTFPMIW